jgi:hypothetical protein
MPQLKSLGNRAQVAPPSASAGAGPYEGAPLAESLLRGIHRSRRLKETADDYPSVVTTIGDKLRVIECAQKIQWVLQRRIDGGAFPWRATAFCRTKAALFRCISERYSGPIPPALIALTERAHGTSG